MPGELFKGLGGGPSAMGLDWASILLLVFYLYLLVRWQYVKRPSLFLLGSVGILATFVGYFFSLGGSGATYVTYVLGYIGAIVAFAGAVGACYGATLPVRLPDNLGGSGTPPPDSK